ncbi:MAG: hypothetical protein AAB592_03025 [Patescibacteria group bacterium]
MVSTLKLFGKGQVTLPKAWRDKVKTANFLAEETAEGLLIKPLTEAVYYEIDDENFGLHFPTGIEASKLLAKLKKANGEIH